MPPTTATVNRLAAACLGAALLLPGCGPAADAGPTTRPPAAGQVTVLAASSLTDAFGAIGQDFEAAHPGVDVRFSFAGSQALASQVLQGAPAGVFASADLQQVRRVADAGLLAGDPVTFTGNRLAIAVEPGNPEQIGGLEDLADPDLVVVLAAPQVPAGGYTSRVLASAGVQVQPDSLETDVRSVLSKVVLGEADAGIVYRSDIVTAGDDVAAVQVPAEVNVTATYAIGVLADATDPAAAAAFVTFVRSERSQATLAEFGFAPPPP